MMSRKIYLLGVGAALIAGCSGKPPGCADSDTVDQIKVDIVNALMNKYSKNIAQDDPDRVLKKFMDGLKIELSNIVTNGYDEKAKKYSCGGNLKISMIDGVTAGRAVDYTIQKMEGNSEKKFSLEIDGFSQFVFLAMKNSEEYYDKNRWVGEWNGGIQCEGIAGASSGALGPFAIPVTMKVEEKSATVDVVAGDFKDSLQGSISTVGGIMRVPGNMGLYPNRSGMRLSQLEMHFDTGFFDKDNYEAKGNVSYAGVVQRECKIKLSRGVAVQKMEKLTESPIMYIEKKKDISNEYDYSEKVTIVGDVEYLPEGSGIGLSTNKGHLSLYAINMSSQTYDDATKLKKNQCIALYSNSPIKFNDSTDVQIKKIVASCSE